MNQAVKDELKDRANKRRGYAALCKKSAEEMQEEEASKLLCSAKQAELEAIEFDRLLAIYEAAK